jgi:hypothetical protein
MEQLDPAASVAPQAFAPVEMAKSLGLAPVMLGTMLFSAAVPVFDNVAANADEVVPLGVFGNEMEEVKVAVVPVVGLRSWNDSAHEPEMPIVAKHAPAADTWPFALYQASTPEASLISQ